MINLTNIYQYLVKDNILQSFADVMIKTGNLALNSKWLSQL